MDGQLLPGGRSGGGQGTAQLQVAHRLGDIVFQQVAGQLHRGLAQAEDGQMNPRPAQLDCLIQAGHRQHLRPQVLEGLGDGDRAVAVSVGLHHA